MLKADWKSTALIASISVVSVVWLFYTAIVDQNVAGMKLAGHGR